MLIAAVIVLSTLSATLAGAVAIGPREPADRWRMTVVVMTGIAAVILGSHL